MVEYIDVIDNPNNGGKKRRYEGARWREAIISFLFGTWAGDNRSLDISGLWLKPKDGAYHLFETTRSTAPENSNVLRSGRDTLRVDIRDQLQVQTGLARFVKNDNIGQLIIESLRPELHLLKGLRRGELYIWTM